MHSFLPAGSPTSHALCSPNSPCVPALAGGIDLPMEVLLELQAGIRRVPLERVRQTDRQTNGHITLQSCDSITEQDSEVVTCRNHLSLTPGSLISFPWSLCHIHPLSCQQHQDSRSYVSRRGAAGAEPDQRAQVETRKAGPHLGWLCPYYGHMAGFCLLWSSWGETKGEL